MEKPQLKNKAYSPLGRGLLSYLNYTAAEKKQLANYLLGKEQVPVLEPKISLGEISRLEGLLNRARNEYKNDGLQTREFAAVKADELKFLREYLQFLKDSNQPKFLKRIISHYGEIDKDLFHFHLNNLLARANAHKRNKVILKELQGLVAREVATDSSRHHEYNISLKLFSQVRKVFKNLYKSELSLLRRSLGEIDTDDQYSAKELRSLLNQLLEFYKLDGKGWKTIISKETDKVSINRLQAEVRVSASIFRFSRPRMVGLLLHEICAHILAHQNISRARDLTDMPPRAVEEGLGVFLEQLILREPHYMRVYRYLAIGLAMGTDGTPRDMRQVFEILWRLRYLTGQSSSVNYAKDYAIKEVLRVFRGIPPTTSGVVLTKDKVYLEGNHFIWKLAARGELQLIFNDFLGKGIRNTIKE